MFSAASASSAADALKRVREEVSYAHAKMQEEAERIDQIAAAKLLKLRAQAQDRRCMCAGINLGGTWVEASTQLDTIVDVGAGARASKACGICGTHYYCDAVSGAWSRLSFRDVLLRASPTWPVVQSEHKKWVQQLAEEEAGFAKLVLAEAYALHASGEWREELLEAEEEEHTDRPRGTEEEARAHLVHLASYLALAAPAVAIVRAEGQAGTGEEMPEVPAAVARSSIGLKLSFTHLSFTRRKKKGPSRPSSTLAD